MTIIPTRVRASTPDLRLVLALVRAVVRVLFVLVRAGLVRLLPPGHSAPSHAGVWMIPATVVLAVGVGLALRGVIA